MALVDINKLNAEAKDNVFMRHKVLNPPMLAPEKMSDTLKLDAGDVNYYHKNIQEEMVQPIDVGADLSAGYQEILDTREIIEKHFFVDYFLMLARRDVEMTATEVIERQQEQSIMLGPFISIMYTEAYDSIIDRTWQLCWDHGKLPPPPAILYQFLDPSKPEFFDVEYHGPIAQAQKILFKSPKRKLDAILPYVQMFPGWMDFIDADELFKKFADAHDFTSLRSESEVKKIRLQRQERQQAQEQAAMLESSARAAKDAAKADTQGGQSMLDMYLQQQR